MIKEDINSKPDSSLNRGCSIHTNLQQHLHQQNFLRILSEKLLVCIMQQSFLLLLLFLLIIIVITCSQRLLATARSTITTITTTATTTSSSNSSIIVGLFWNMKCNIKEVALVFDMIM